MGLLKVKSSATGKLKTKSGISENLKSALYASMPGGLTFFKDYEKCDSINADFSLGSPTGVFTSARSASAPATYIDENGVIQVITTANVPRFTKGYYDETGFHRKNGLLIETAGTNLLNYTDGTVYGSGLWTNWTIANTITGSITKTNVLIPELLGIVGATSQRVQYMGGVGDVPDKYVDIRATKSANGSIVQNDIVSSSVYIRSKTGNSGIVVRLVNSFRDASNLEIESDISSDIVNQITTKWKRFIYTSTANHANTNSCRFSVFITNIGNGDSVDIEIACPQLEKNSYATSFIPTTTASLNRAKESLLYLILNNRTASEESIFIKFAPISDFTSDGTVRGIHDTQTKRRLSQKEGSTFIQSYINANDNITAKCPNSTNILEYTSYVLANIIQHSSPYLEVYLDGVSEGKYTIADWTNNAWGTYFSIGNNIADVQQLNGIIQRVAFFNQAKGLTDIRKITEILGS